MASSLVVRKGRKHKMRLMTDNNDDQMVVKSLSVPPGLEALMEGLTREVLRMQPQDICLFASEHFAKLIKMREATGDGHQFCKTTIHDKIKQKNAPSRVSTQQNHQPCPKDDVETIDGTSSSPPLSAPRLTNGVSPEIKRNISEASTAEIDKIQGGFFDSKPAVDAINSQIKKTNEHVNTDDEVVNNKQEEHGTITGVQIKENKTEADDVKNIKPTELDDSESSKTEEKDDDVTKEVNEEISKSKENVESNTVEEDTARKENQIQEKETKDDKEICEKVEKNAVTKECTEIPDEEENVKQKEEINKEVIVAHDEPKEPKTINIANEVDPENKEKLDDIQEAKIEHLTATGKEVALNETEKKETGNNVEDAKLEATEEHDDLSDSNDVVTQETEQELKTMSPADKVQISPVEENTDDRSSVEDKPVQSSETEVEHLKDSTEAKLVDKKHEEQVEDKSTENESHTSLEKAVINDEITEKDSNKTPVHNTQVEDVQTDGVVISSLENGEHDIRKRSVAQAEENEVQNLTIPEISTTGATPTPSEDGSTFGDNVPKELHESENLTGDDNATEEEKQIKAATKLQSLWRGYSLRKMQKSATVNNAVDNEEKSEDLHKLTTAATVIQALWRGHSFRKSKAKETSTDEIENITSNETSPDKEAKDATDEQNIAATKIQSSWCGHNVRKKRHIDMNDFASDGEHDKTVGEGKPDEKVATPTPSEDGSTFGDNVPNELHESENLTGDDNATEEEKQIKAATKLQSLWRGYSLRKMQKSATVNNAVDNEEKSEDLHKLTTAATVIQALWRGHSFRKSKAKETSTDEIENITSNETSPDKEAKDATDEQNIAATKIQSSWRGHNVRKKRHIDMNDSASDEEHDKTVGEGKPGEKVVENDSQDKEIAKEIIAATVIQALWRGYAMRKSRNLESENESTQRNTDVDIGKLNLAAAKIQSVWRGHNFRKQNSSRTVVAEHEMPVKEVESISETREHEKEEATDATTANSELHAERKTDTNIIEFAKPTSEAEKVTEETEPAVETENATEITSEHQPSNSAGNAIQDTTVPELGTEKINDTVELEIEAKKASKVESGNIAETTDSEANIEGVTASPKSDLEDEKTAEASEHPEDVDSVSKTATDVPESQNELAESNKTSDENNESIKNTDAPESEIKSEEVSETAAPFVKAAEIGKTDDSEVKSEKDGEKTESAVKADETLGEVKSEEIAEKTEPVIKTAESEDELKSEVTEKHEPAVKADETEGEVKSEVAETTDPAVKADETEGEVKSAEVAETTDPSVKADKTEGQVKSEEVAETTDSSVKADETEGEVKSAEVAETTVPSVKADETESEVKSEEVTETTDPSVKADETEGEVKSEVAEKTELAVKADETEGEVKPEVAEKTDPAVKADETEGEVKSAEVAETTVPSVKADETEDEVKSEVTEKTEPAVKADETEGEVKSAETTDPAVKSDETEGEVKSAEVAEITVPSVKADETEDEVKSAEVAETTDPSVKADETEGEVKLKEVAEITEPGVKADETEGEVKSEVAEKTEPAVKADETEGEVKSEVAEKTEPAVKADETEGVVKSEEVAETAEPVIKTDESEGEVKSEVAEKTEPVVKADESETEDKSENIAEKAEPHIKAEEIVKTDEGEVKPDEDAEKTDSGVKADDVESEVKSDEDSQTAKPVMNADAVEGEVKSEIVEPVVKKEENVDTAEPKIKSEEFTETSDSTVKPEEIIEGTKTAGEVNLENISGLAEPTESKDISETTENYVKPGEIGEPEVKDEEIADKVEPSVVDETTETGDSSVSGKDASLTTNSSTTAEKVTDSVKSTTVVEPNEIANIPVLKTDEISEKTASEAKDTDTKKTDESEMDAETNKDESAPVSENITQEMAEKVETSPTETKNENDSGEKTELNSDKDIDSAGTAVKDTEETHAIDNNVNELDEAKTISDSEKVSETNENDKEKIESAIIPGSENNTSETEVKNSDMTDKNDVEISTESPKNITITTPSEDTKSEVDHASEITKNNDNLSSESPEIAVSDAAAENKESESTVTMDEGLKEPSTTISPDSTEEKSTKLDENIDVKPTHVIVEDNSEQDKLTNSLDGTINEETNKDVNINTDASDRTETHGTKNTESDENEQIDTKENVTETLSPLDETQVDVDKRDEITEPEIKKESVEADEASPIDASPPNQGENETEMKINETDENSTNDSITDIIKNDNPTEATESSEIPNENKSEIISENKSADDDQSVVKTDNTHHVDTEIQCPKISNNGADTIEAKDNGKQDVTDKTAEQEDSVKEKDAATKIQSTWRGYIVRKSNNIIADGKDPEIKSENDNETEENVEKSSEDTGSKTESNEDEIAKPTVDTAEKTVGTAEKNVNESANMDETVHKVENVPDEAAKENVATEISEPVAEKINHSSVNSVNINEVRINDASEINKEETVGDSSSTDENKLEDTVTNPVTKTAVVETAEHVSNLIRNREDISLVPADETVQQETTEKIEETSPNSTDNKAENVESGDKLKDDSEKHVEITNVEHDGKIKEENETCPEVTDTADSGAEDHKDTYQASEASTVDIRDVEDSLKSPVLAEDGNDLEINVHEDGEKLNESSDTKNSLDADNKVKFYVGPDESNHIRIVDDVTKEGENHVNENTESDKLAVDGVTNENNKEIRKSVTSVLLTALSDDSDELEKGEATKEINDANVTETDQSIDGKKTASADEEHQNDDENIASTVNSSVSNSEENPNKNIEDAKENPTENAEDAKAENINETQDNQAQNSVDNNTENIEIHTAKSPENVSDIANDKLDANHDDDKQKLAMNIQYFDKALSESENKEKESNDLHVDTDVVDESVTDKKATDNVVENNTVTETVNVAPLAEEQHAVNSENKSDSVQNKDSDPFSTNLHEDKSSESATNDSNVAETTQDTVEGIITPVEQHENTEAVEATTHTLLNTAAKDISHKSDSMSPSDIIEEGTHAADNGNNEHESEEAHEESHTPVTTTAEDTEIPHELENESPASVNDEDKHTVDEVDNDPKNVGDGILHTPVGHESESKSSASDNHTDENKNIELDETRTPVVTTTEDNQKESNEQIKHLEEKDTDKNIEENESEQLDKTTKGPSTEDIKDEGNKNNEHSEANIKNDIKKNEENEHVPVDSNISDAEPASQDKSVDDKEHDTTNDKDVKENINEDNTAGKNENYLISNAEIQSAVNHMNEENKNEDKPEDEIKIKDIESQIEHDITDDDAETKQNDGATENAGHNTAPLEKEVESSEENNEKSAAVTKDDNKTEADKAAVKIQSAWKGYHVRHTLNEGKELGLLQRPAECDELSSKTDEAEDADILSQAATTIQAGARGYLVRKRRHLANITEVPSEKADSTTVDESDSASQETVIEKQADTLDTSQSFGSTENAKSEEENTHDGTSKEETQSNQEESKSTIIPEETKDFESNTLDAEKSEADAESIMESRNDNTNGNDVKKETEIKDVDNKKENIAESKHETSAEINESVEKHSNKEEELDEIGALNLRLRNLNRTNVYQKEEKEPDDKIEDNHKTDSPKAKKLNFDRALSDLHPQTSKSLDDDESVMTAPSNTDDSHNDDANKPDDDKELETNDKPSHEEPDAENKEVAQILEQPKANTTPRLSVNIDDFDSSKYDLKVEHATPRSKNTSPVHELTSAAYKIGAAIAVDDEAIVDAMDENAKDKLEGKPVEYIHIPLQGPLPVSVEEKPIEKETLKASQEHVTSGKSKDDGESPEYIYIPLKPPGTVDEDNDKVDEESTLKENMGNAHTEVDNQKEETKNETDTIPRAPTVNKDNNEDNLKERLPVSMHDEHLKPEQIEEKEDSTDKSNDTDIVLEDKAEEDNNSKVEDHELSGKERIDAKEIHETLADHAIEKEGENEAEQITTIPKPIPLMNKPSDQVLSNQPLLAKAEPSELKLSHSKSPEPTHSGKLDEKSPELQLSESQPAHLIVSEEPIEKLTAKQNLEKSPVSEPKTPEPELSEFKSTDSKVSGQSTENLTTEKDTDKSLIEHTSAESELLENKSAEPLLSEIKNPGSESDNTGSGDLLSEERKASGGIASVTKSSEPGHSEQVEKTKGDTDETSRTPSPGKSTSPIDDIDAFLQRNKSRTISRQQNVDSSSHRTLFAEIDSLIDAYGQKRQMSPTSNDHPNLASAKIENESRAQGQQLSVQDDLPDVIMANSNSADLAATKIQSAYRGYHARQQLKQEQQGANRLEEAQPRKNSSESDKTYTIDKHSQGNGSTPDEDVSSDDDGMKNKAATKIQTTFREYRKKRSTEQNKSIKEEKNVPDSEQKSEVTEKHVNEISTEQNTKDVKTEEPVEHSNKKSEEKHPSLDQNSEQLDKNKELEESVENSENQHAEHQHKTSLVDVNDESVQQKTSPDLKPVNTLEVTTHNTDEEKKVTNENTAGSLEVHQPHADYDSLNSEQEIRHSPELGQVQDLKITKLEDKFLDHVVTNDSGTDAKHEELKDISEITHDAAIKIQSTYRGFKTRQTLKNDNQLDRPLDTIPEVTSPTGLDVNKEHETTEQGKNEHTDEDTTNDEHVTDHVYINGTAVQPHVKSSGDVDELSRQNSAEQKYKSSNVARLSNRETLQNLNRLSSSAPHDVASTSDAWRYQLVPDATTDGDSTGKDETTSGIRSDSTIYDEDDSEPYARSSPDGKLVQGTHHQNAEQPAGLQHSGEMHDTLDIFLSSEELSQGAEVLTSRDTSTKDDSAGRNVTSAHAQSGTAAKHEGPEQHDVHSVMETAKNQGTNNTPTTQHNQQQQHEQQQQQTVTDMGNDEAVAATKIQAGFRGYQVRKQMKLKKNGSDDAKMVKRCSSGRRRGSLRRGETPKNGTDLEERSATKIQAGIRGFLVRKRQKSTKDKQ